MSRPLPNVMALPLVLLAIDSWLRREKKKFLLFSGASIIIFRSELVILLGLLLLYDLFYKRMTMKELITIGVPTGLGLIALTITVDSFFWRRLLWPEAEVLWFNSIMNKSSEWGTSPFLWYFYSALPRALGLSLIFVPYGLYCESRIRAITIPALVFVLIYSVLPHKELRFIIYVFPMLNVASACACHRIWNNRMKSRWQALFALIAGGHLLGNFTLSIFLLTVSGTNYPGGIAMSRLHRIAAKEPNITIHIDNLTAQSGVTRFTEINANWTYSKDEHLKAGDEELHKFDYLLTEVKNKYAPEMRFLQQTHEKLELIECFSNIGVHYTSLIPIKIRTKPCIMIMKRKPNAVLLKRFFSVEEISDSDNNDDNFVDDVALPISEEYEDEIEIEQKEEIQRRPLKRKRLRPTTLTPKIKIKEIIEAERLEAALANSRDEEDLSEMTSNEPSSIIDEDNDISEMESGNDVEGNDQRTLSEEKTKQFIKEINQLDLSAFCDLSQMDRKECLKKILDESNE